MFAMPVGLARIFEQAISLDIFCHLVTAVFYGDATVSAHAQRESLVRQSESMLDMSVVLGKASKAKAFEQTNCFRSSALLPTPPATPTPFIPSTLRYLWTLSRSSAPIGSPHIIALCCHYFAFSTIDFGPFPFALPIAVRQPSRVITRTLSTELLTLCPLRHPFAI